GSHLVGTQEPWPPSCCGWLAIARKHARRLHWGVNTSAAVGTRRKPLTILRTLSKSFRERSGDRIAPGHRYKALDRAYPPTSRLLRLTVEGSHTLRPVAFGNRPSGDPND